MTVNHQPQKSTMFENMLDYIRIALYTLLLVLSLFLVQMWERDHPKVEQTQTSTETANVPTAASNAPTVQAANPAAPAVPADVKGQIVTVTTDLLEAQIDSRGGDVVSVKLIKYPASLHSNIPFTLLNDDPKTQYLAESGLLSQVGPDTSNQQALYTVSQTNYALSPDQKELTVDLTWNKDGIAVTKQFTFTRDSYEIKVGYTVNNQSSQPWQGSLYTQLLRTNTPTEHRSGMMNLATYFGAAISSPEKPFEKISFKNMQEKNLSQTIQNGWAAMIQHYFISAWVPPQGAISDYYSKVTNSGLYTIGMIGKPIVVAPGAKATTQAKLYTGPAIADNLEKTAPGLKLTIDYGWFWFFSNIIFWMMQHIYDVVGNWGVAIILVTIIIKLMFYQLSAKSYRSMSALKRLQPKIEMLKERYGDDKQGMTKATLELYRQEKVSPMSGCLPIVIQIPVFIALYWVLVESVQLRQAPFMLWIHDLSVPDPFYILPILMGISMFVQQRLNPPPPDPTQAKVMMMMPVVFTIMFANFPAGLMLYWFVNNTLSVLQQWYIMRSVNGKSKK